MAEVLSVVLFDEDLDKVVVADVDEVKVAIAVVGSMLRPTSLLLENSSKRIRVPQKTMIRRRRKMMCRRILFA